MTCKKVSELLTPFIEGALDAGDRAFVEQHLEACEKCTAELASLKAYFRKMASLEDMSPPEDFLNQVHARLEQEKGFKKIMRSLFVPLHIKIPVEVAAMALVFFLLVWFVRDEISEKSMERIPFTAESRSVPESKVRRERIKPEEAGGKMGEKSPAVEKRGKKGAEVTAESAEEEIYRESSTAPPGGMAQFEDADGPVTETLPVELNLRIYPERTSAKAVGYAPTVAVSEKRDRTTLPPASRDAEVIAESDKIEGEEQAVEFHRHMKKEKGPSQPQGILDLIRGMALRLGGKIIQLENEGVPGRDQCITVELPFDQYPSFLLELQTLGYLEEPSPVIEDKGSPVLLRIRPQDALRSRTDSNPENTTDSPDPAGTVSY